MEKNLKQIISIILIISMLFPLSVVYGLDEGLPTYQEASIEITESEEIVPKEGTLEEIPQSEAPIEGASREEAIKITAEEEFVVLELYSRYEFFESMSKEEQELFCSILKLDEKDLKKLGNEGYNLQKSLKILNIISTYQLDFKEFKELLKVYLDIEILNDILYRRNLILKEFNATEEEKESIYKLLLKEYQLKSIRGAFIVSRALKVDIESIIEDQSVNGKEREERYKDKFYTERDKEIIAQLEDTYSIDFNKILNLELFKDKTPEEIQKIILEYEMNFNTIPPQEDFNLQSTSSVDPEYSKEYIAPFTINQNNESISPNSGSLTYYGTGISLPGRNGLDVNVTPQYISRNASLLEEDYTDYQQNLTNPNTFIEKSSQLGSGWSWGLPVIEIIDYKKYLHLGNGEVYLLANSSVIGQLDLVNYKLKDISVNIHIGDFTTTDSSGATIKSYYTLTAKDGTKTYFADDGRLLAMKDRYDNTITFQHTLIDGYPVISRIIDTIQREITFEYNTTTTGKEVVVTAPGNRVIKYILEPIAGETNEYQLKEIIGPIGRSTSFEYSLQDGNFDFFSKDSRTTNNKYLNLVQVTHPTGAQTKYSYEMVVENLGSKGTKESYRINTREEQDGARIFNKETFSYSPNNFTGYPLYKDPFYINGSFTYSTTITNTDGTKNTYTFNKMNLVILETIIQSDGKKLKTTEHQYNSYNLPTQTITRQYNPVNGQYSEGMEKYTYDIYGDLVEYTDPVGNKTSKLYYTIDQYRLPKRITKLVGYTVKSMTEYEVNSTSSKNIDWIKNWDPVTGITHLTTYLVYDNYGNIIKKNTKGVGGNTEEIYQYSSLYKYAYPIQKSVVYKGYDIKEGTTSWPLVNKTAITNYTYNINTGDRTSITDGNGNRTDYQYDLIGRLTQTKQPDGSTYTAHYDDIANIVTITDPNLYTIRKVYDGIGQLKATQEYKDSGWITLEEKDYDSLGRLQWTKDAKAQPTSYIYDPLGREIQQINPDNTTIRTVYSDDTRTKIIYDEENKEKYYKYDAVGNVIEEGIKPNTTRFIAYYTYDYAGKVLTHRDFNGNTTQYTYDQLERLIEVTNPLGEKTKYEYNYLGNMTKMTTAGGSITIKEYDQLGRQIKEINPMGEEELTAYDPVGNIKYRVDKGKAITSYTYDSLSRLITEKKGPLITGYTYNKVGKILTITDATGTITYSYTPNGRLKRETQPDGKYVEYTYDAQGNRLTMTDHFGKITSYSYDNRNRLKTVTVDSKTTTYEYYKNSNKKKATHPNGIYVYYTYDGVNNLLTLTNKKADHSIINSYQYTYDKNGNQLSKKEGTLINSYTYDALNRVSTETEANGTKTIYHYDSNGNILKKEIQHSATGQFLFKEEHIEKIMTGISLHIIEYTYDQANKLLSSLETVDNTQETATTPENLYVGIMQIPANYTYDLHGNLIGEAKGGTYGTGATADLEVSTYQYNEKNQLIESINKEGAVTTYGYNPRGLRRSKTTGGNTLGYYYDGANIIIETQNNNLLARNIRGLNLISREEGTTVGYYLFNGHGDVVKLVDNTGTDISNYDYEIYGVEKEATEGMIKNPFRYAGEYYDEETGFYYLRARYYHPEIARFVSEDTYKGELTDPLTLNYYIYCLGNPIRYVDPSGNMARRVRQVENDDGSIMLTWATDESEIKQTTYRVYVLSNNNELADTYETILKADYGQKGLRWASDMVVGMADYLNMTDLLGVSIFEAPGRTDPFNNILWIEEGYKIAEKSRLFYEDDVIFRETEVIIYDEQGNVVYHNTRIDFKIQD